MITIPLSYRKKYHLKPGDKMGIFERNGELVLIPLVDLDKERKNFVSATEMEAYLEKAKAQDIELENNKGF
jgi:bifunctional DNA-binding transcriptional regulator/antitoxin component of YhaV-PrlF toxin-antitoxin module